MFCRSCGKEIKNESVFCPYCGKKTCQDEIKPRSKKIEKQDLPDFEVLPILSSIIFYIGIIVFLLLNIKMAPGIGRMHTIHYCVGAAIIVLLACAIGAFRSQEITNAGHIVALIFGLILLVSSIGLRIVYEAKIDEALSDIPNTGSVYVTVKLNEKFYARETGTVENPYSYIIIDNQRYDDTTTICVELNKEYSIQIGAGYRNKTGVSNSSAHGKTSRSISFLPESLRSDYSLLEKVPLESSSNQGEIYANVTIYFERFCPFWDVILK